MATRKRDEAFRWQEGSEPPNLEAHSDAKLRLLELYLVRYFETVASDPRLDRLAISFVDGFCGGGQFRFNGRERPGSPLVMLDAVREAERKLNVGRRKPVAIDARFYFVDKDVDATNFLRNLIRQGPYSTQIGTSIEIINGDFNQLAEEIASQISARHRAGRSLFLLDQCGWNEVPLGTIRGIFQSLPRSEIILTFAIDWLITYVNNSTAFLTALAPIEVSQEQLRRFLDSKGRPGYRYLIQRLLLKHLNDRIGAPFFTPFFLHSEEAGMDLWLIHLSKIATARNVMTATHWDIKNDSLHHGDAGLDMLGFKPDWEDRLPLDFKFDGNAEVMIGRALLSELPFIIEWLSGSEPPTFELLLSSIANNTAATKEQIESALLRLHGEKEIDLLTGTGGRKREGSKLSMTDRIDIARQLHFLTSRPH